MGAAETDISSTTFGDVEMLEGQDQELVVGSGTLVKVERATNLV